MAAKETDIAEVHDQLQQRNERITELESRIANVERAAVRGLCVLHHWGAPPGEDDLPCPYCVGVLRTR